MPESRSSLRHSSLPVNEVHEHQPSPGRVSEKVRRYLEAEFLVRNHAVGTRLPTVREIASLMKVSFPTVQTEIQRLVKDGYLRTEVGNGTFLLRSRKPKKGTLYVALSQKLPRVLPEEGRYKDYEELWAHRVYGGILSRALECPHPVAVTQLSAGVDGKVSSKTLIEAADKVDGAILLWSGYGREVDEAYQAEGKPLVHFNLQDEMATANFVAFDPKNAMKRCTEAAMQTGRKRFLLMLRSPLQSEAHHRLRYQAMMHVLRLDKNTHLTLQLSEAKSYKIHDGKIAMQNALDAGYRPDFVVCSGDLLALGAIEALQEKGIRVPDEVSVIGGSGFDLERESWPKLTRTQQPLETLGRELLSMLWKRIELQGVDLPGLFLETPFRGGASTRPEENAILGLAATVEECDRYE